MGSVINCGFESGSQIDKLQNSGDGVSGLSLYLDLVRGLWYSTKDSDVSFISILSLFFQSLVSFEMAESEKGAWTNVDPSSTSSEVAAGQVEKQSPTNGIIQRLKGTKTDPDELGRQLFEESQQYDEAQLERDAVKVRRKLDFLLLPMVPLPPVNFPDPTFS